MWLGNSERNLHDVFEHARRNAPCVLFFDEVDAIGQRRINLRASPAMRGVVNQFLAEFDGVHSNNEGVYVMGATNHPWDVDTALRRPGRFDRLLLVLPPDQAARTAILSRRLRDVPTEGIDAKTIAEFAARTDRFSGADLNLVVETATEAALADTISSGAIRPVVKRDLVDALKEVKPSINPWLETARNFAVFANQDGTYDDLIAYMRSIR
jgi:SpoVK/Ycf46/Vps4 family AAA+-type ATPase